MRMHISPELGERLKTPGAAAAGGIALGTAETVYKVYVNADGITVGARNDLMDSANDTIDTYQQVQRNAERSSSPDAAAAGRFAKQKIKQAKKGIVEVSGKDPVNSFQDHVDAFMGWGALAGMAIGTVIARIQRRRHRSSAD